MTCVQARRHDATTVGNRTPHGPRSKASSAGSGGVGARRGVDRPQRRRQRLALFPIRKVQTVAQQMDDAGLQRRRRIDGRQRLAHALEAIGHGDEDVLAAARLQVGEDLHPELRAFGLLDPDPEDVAACRRAGRPAPDRPPCCAPIASSRILTRSASKNTTGYIGSSGRLCHAVTSATTASVTVLIRSGETSTRIHLGEERLNLAHRHPAGVERQDLVVEAGEAALVLARSAAARTCPSRSRGTSSASGPSSVSTVLPLVPLR